MRSQEYKHLYDRADWKRLRRWKLRKDPLCERCKRSTPPAVRSATVVHHIVAHEGDMRLFLMPTNLQSLCKPHHDREAQQEEARGYHSSSDAQGYPTDPNHPFNR